MPLTVNWKQTLHPKFVNIVIEGKITQLHFTCMEQMAVCQAVHYLSFYLPPFLHTPSFLPFKGIHITDSEVEVQEDEKSNVLKYHHWEKY